MPARRMISTYRTPQAAHQRVLLAREELRAEAERRAAAAERTAAEAEPMRRWPHPIPTADAARSSRCAGSGEETAALLTQALEKLQYQSQALTDILAAVNSLTAAVLVRSAEKQTTSDTGLERG